MYTYIYICIYTYILYLICNHSLFYFGFASFQHSETALSKKGPLDRKGLLRAHAKTNQISSSVRTEPPDRLGSTRCTREIRKMQIGMQIGGLSRQMVGSKETKIHLNAKLMTNYISWGYWYHIVRQTPKSPIASKERQL